MFTGIIQGIGVIRRRRVAHGIRQLTVCLPSDLTAHLAVGNSVSIDGVCLTVTAVLPDHCAQFDVIGETLSRTTLSQLTEGDPVNLERAATLNAEIGGHVMSGHIDCTGQVSQILQAENNKTVRIQVPESCRYYLFNKGYIGVHGASLTIAHCHREESWFDVCLIPETRRLTNLDQKGLGDSLNIEIDRQTQVIVETVQAMLEANRFLG